MAFYSCEDYLSLPRPVETWVIENLLPSGGTANIFGKAKVGKSSLSLQMADAIGDPDQTEFLGMPVCSHGPVLYVQFDTPRSLWTLQIEAHFKPAGHALKGVFFSDNLLHPYPFNILRKECEDSLRRDVLECGPSVVIIDTLREVHDGDENDSGHMKRVVNTLYEVCRPAALILLSHPRKQQSDAPADLMSENRGSNFVSGRVDAIIKVTESKLIYRSRTAGETTIAVSRTPVLYRRADSVTLRVLEVAKRLTGSPQPVIVAALCSELGLSPEAARSRLRRAMSDPSATAAPEVG